MRLQIKKLEGPDEIRVSAMQGSTIAATPATATAINRFTCHLNRSVEDSDAFPLRVNIDVYNGQGISQYMTVLLTLQRQNIHDGDHFYFTLNIGSPLLLSGSYIRVQALLRNRISATTYISLATARKSHETAKKVLIYAEKTINHVYWSKNEVIDIDRLDEQENPRSGNIGQNEDAFLHIKTAGMYNDSVQVKLTSSDNRTLLTRSVTLSQNHKVVAFSMADVIAKHRGSGGSGSFSILAMVTYSGQNWGNPSFPTIRDLAVMPQSTPAALDIVLEDKTNPAKKTSTGTVFVNVNTGEPEPVTLTQYTDFELGYVAHLLSDATIHKGVAGSKSVGGVARYPFHFYVLKLSDLVDCGVVTTEHARELTLAKDGKTLKSPQTMVGEFDKHKVFGGQSMIGRVANGNNIDTDTIVKILKYVSREEGQGIAETKEVCRDAWQYSTSKKGVVTATNRYADDGAECPPGGYTINFVDGDFEVYFSSLASTDNKQIPQPQRIRSGLAIHRGDAYTATGCTTLYTRYGDYTEQYNLLELLFRTQDRTKSTRPSFNKKRLILAYIEERNAHLTHNYVGRHYDIIAPGGFISSIQGPNTIIAGENAVYILIINKKYLASGDSIASEETESIRWQISTGGGFRALNADGQTSVTITIEAGWAGKTITIKAYSDLSQGKGDTTTKRTIVAKKKS